MTTTSTTTKALTLTPVRPDNLTVYANPNDLRRDLHTFVGYVSRRTIKRSYRENDLPQADYKRLMQVIEDGGPGWGEGSGSDGTSYRYVAEAYSWIYYLDRVALKMGWVNYNTKGLYRGYSSADPSFPDNFIRFNADAYHAFLALPLAEQERQLFDTLVDDYGASYNEFFIGGVLGRLDRFPSWGGSTGVIPTLNFAAIRRFLFELLQGCEPGVWYGTADLVAYLKATHPFFLIPRPSDNKNKNKKRPTAIQNRYRTLQETPEKRYGNFYENDDAHSYNRGAIPDDAPDGFERVEGRYVERFLEGLPLTLGYVDVAYARRSESSSRPSRGLLRAFRVNERFLQAMRGAIARPRVIVQPNFEIYIESAFYPASLVNRLAPLTDVIREDTTTILKLHRQKVAAQLAENAGLDVIALLKNLSGQELPQNVSVELQDWAGQADVFTLYAGFGLVESAEPVDGRLVDPVTVERIGDSLRLVRDPGALFSRLMESGAVALRIRHADAALQPLPDKARTVFPRAIAAAQAQKAKTKRAVTLKRQTLVALHFPDDDLFDVFRQALFEARCVLDVDKEKRVLTLSGKDDAHLKAIIKRLSGEYAIRLEDLE